MKEEKTFTESYVRPGKFWYRLARIAVIIVGHILFRIRIRNKKNIPAKGAVILACNHVNTCDPGFMMMATKRAIRFLAKKELHESRFASVFRACLTIPVDRSRHNSEVMEAALFALKQEEMLGIFPEGTRNSHPDELLPLHYGAVSLAQQSGARIVPMALSGSFRPFTKVILNIGEAYEVKPEEDLEKANQELSQKISQLREKE